ncbi:MAG: hypothetical protein LAN83_03545 [Acidobacteriia bacterium]|nr:hypothetical protein [Terriglobia bacterium]
MAAALTDVELKQLIDGFTAYVERQRNHYFPLAVPLDPQQKEPLEPFFSRTLFDRVRIVELQQERLAGPPESVRSILGRGMEVPEIAHMASFTMVDVMIFQETVTPRRLFHALVHAAQFALLGTRPYLELYIRAFAKAGRYLAVPLEVQAFRMDARFTESPAEVFSVADEVLLWAERGLYRQA